MASASDPDRSAVVRWSSVTRWPLLIAAAATVPVNIAAQLARSDAPSAASALDLAVRLVQVALAVDLLIHLSAASDRWWYLLHHKLDALSIAVPPVRLLREFDLVRGVFLRPGLQRFVTFAIASMLIGAAMVYASERGEPDATITSFGDALWWASVTSTTVGYGDRVPVTFEGRLIALALMLLGIALFAVLTAHVAAHFVTDDRSDVQLLASIDERLGRIERRLEAMETDAPLQAPGATAEDP